jgi:hypothetical protein
MAPKAVLAEVPRDTRTAAEPAGFRFDRREGEEGARAGGATGFCWPSIGVKLQLRSGILKFTKL